MFGTKIIPRSAIWLAPPNPEMIEWHDEDIISN